MNSLPVLKNKIFVILNKKIWVPRLTIKIEREGETEPWLITDIRAFDNAQPIRTIIQWAVEQLRVPASLDFWPNDAWYLPVGQNIRLFPSQLLKIVHR